MIYELSYYMPEDDHGAVVASYTDAASMVAYMEREYGRLQGMTLWIVAAIAGNYPRTEFDNDYGTVWTFTIR